MAAPTTEFENGTGTIGVTGEDDGLLLKLNPVTSPDRVEIGFSGTFSSLSAVVRGRLSALSAYYPLQAINCTTGLPVDSTALTPADSTATKYRFDVKGCDRVEVYVASGTPTALTVEARYYAVDGDERPLIVAASANAATLSAGLTFNGATGANDVTIPDNLADAFTLQEGSTSYVTVVTTNSSERVVLNKQTKLADSVKLAFGDADDITVAWDGTDLDVLQATANSSIKWGVDGAGIDHVFYGDTASAAVTWDQSADSLIFSGVAKLKLQTIAAATGTAIPVTHSGSFPITQNGAETNTLADPTFLGQTLSIFVDTDTSGARVITAASRINQAGNTTITLTEVGDFIKLEAITIGGALKWQVVANDGAALS